MKRFLRGLFTVIASLVFVAALAAVSAVVFAPAFFSAGDPSGFCEKYYKGVNKGIVWNNGEWHHYVDVAVDTQAPEYDWDLIEQPLPSSFWKDDPASPYYKRLGYAWPDDWWDPFPAKTWVICLQRS